MDLFNLRAVLDLDSSKYSDGIDKAKSIASTAGKAIGASLAAVTATVGAVTGALVSGTKQTAAYADNIDKMSQKMGISAKAYQEWEAVMQHSGTSMETLKAGMKTLANAVENGNAAFERLGISQQEISKMSNEELFSATITALQGVENETERTYLAGQLLGRGATELGALLNTSAEETQAMKDRVHELGGVLSDEAVKAGAAFQDQLQDMQTSLSGMKNNLMSEFLPSLTTVMAGLTDIFAGDDESGIPAIEKGLDEFVNKISSVLPRVMKLAGRIIKTLASAFVENAPMLIKAAVDVIQELVKGFITALPEITKIAVDIILTLANSIGESLPQLVPAIVDVIIQITETLLNNLDKVIEAGITIIVGLIEGITNALPQIVMQAPQIIITLVTAIIKAIPQLLVAGVEIITTLVSGIFKGFGRLIEAGAEIIPKIWEGIKSAINDAFSWGADLIDNFVSGIFSGVGKLWDSIKSIASGIADFLGFSEPEKGPLSNFHTYAPDMMKLFAKGIEDNEHLITDQIAKSFDFEDMIGNEMNMTADNKSTVNHSGTIRLEGVSNEGEFVAASEYVIEDMITRILSRQARLA